MGDWGVDQLYENPFHYLTCEYLRIGRRDQLWTIKLRLPLEW